MQVSSSNSTLNPATLSSVTDRLFEMSQTQLYGGDIDVITHAMDDVVRRMEVVSVDSANASVDSSAAVRRLFNVRRTMCRHSSLINSVT